MQVNGIVERFHKTMLDEFYRIACRKRIYATIDELQADLDAWLAEYNEVRTHQGRYCYGKTPMQTFLDAASRRPGKADRRASLGHHIGLIANGQFRPSVRSSINFYT